MRGQLCTHPGSCQRQHHSTYSLPAPRCSNSRQPAAGAWPAPPPAKQAQAGPAAPPAAALQRAPAVGARLSAVVLEDLHAEPVEGHGRDGDGYSQRYQQAVVPVRLHRRQQRVLQRRQQRRDLQAGGGHTGRAAGARRSATVLGLHLSQWGDAASRSTLLLEHVPVRLELAGTHRRQARAPQWQRRPPRCCPCRPQSGTHCGRQQTHTAIQCMWLPRVQARAGRGSFGLERHSLHASAAPRLTPGPAA